MAAPPPSRPGLKFCPTDAEIVRNYLMYKILGRPQRDDVIVTIDDAYSSLPQELQSQLDNNDIFVENEWYFYATRTKKSSHVMRNGFYPITGPDKEIFHENKLVGLKRILGFYYGSSKPTAIETEWLVHEYHINSTVFRSEQASVLVMCKLTRTQKASGESSQETSQG